MHGSAVKLAALTAVAGALLFALTGVASAANVSGANATFTGTLTVSGATTLKKTLAVTGASTLTGLVTAKGGLTVATGKATSLGGALTVTGASTLKGNLTVGVSKFVVTAASGNTAIAGTLGVKGNLAVNTNKFTVAGTSGNTTIAGTLGVKGNLAVNTNKFVVTAATGNTAIAGTLGVTGKSTLGQIAQRSGGLFAVSTSGAISGTNLSLGKPGTGGVLVPLFTVNGTDGSLSAGGGNFSVTGNGKIAGATLSLDGGAFMVSSNGRATIAPSARGAVALKVSGAPDSYSDIATFTGHESGSFTIGHDGSISTTGNLSVGGNITYTSENFDVTSAGITSTGTLTADNLVVNTGVSLPAHAIVDGSLSTNVAFLDAASNAFSGDLSAANLSTGGLTVTSTVLLPANSVSDSALSSNVALYDATAPEFGGNMTVDGSLTSGALTADSLTTAGDLSVTGTATTGDLTADSLTTAGALSAGSATIGNLVVTGATIKNIGAPNSYDAGDTLTTGDLLTNGLAVIAATHASQTVGITTPTAAQIVGAMPASTAVGDSFRFTLVNADNAHNQLVSGGTGVTIAGAGYVRYASEYTFTCRVTNAGLGTEAVTCY